MYLAEKREEGMGVEQVASELGVSCWSLVRWSRESTAPSGSVQPVEVAGESGGWNGGEGLAVVTPGGYRVEGLDWRRVLELLEVLG